MHLVADALQQKNHLQGEILCLKEQENEDFTQYHEKWKREDSKNIFFWYDYS